MNVAELSEHAAEVERHARLLRENHASLKTAN
jgi:hypothetical protein